MRNCLWILNWIYPNVYFRRNPCPSLYKTRFFSCFIYNSLEPDGVLFHSKSVWRPSALGKLFTFWTSQIMYSSRGPGKVLYLFGAIWNPRWLLWPLIVRDMFYFCVWSYQNCQTCSSRSSEEVLFLYWAIRSPWWPYWSLIYWNNLNFYSRNTAYQVRVFIKEKLLFLAIWTSRWLLIGRDI